VNSELGGDRVGCERGSRGDGQGGRPNRLDAGIPRGTRVSAVVHNHAAAPGGGTRHGRHEGRASREVRTGMEESAVKARIVDRMTILKVYVSVRAAHDLSDVASALEVLYCEVLNLTKGWDLTSANYPSLNSPAVDLHDKGRRIAVQITATCDTKKITETQETWERNGLSAAYDELIFVGVKSVQKSKYLKPWANIYTQEDLLKPK